MKKKILIALPIALFLLIIIILVAVLLKKENYQPKNSEETATESAKKEEVKKFKGVALSPKTFSVSDLLSFYDEAKEVGNTFTWSGEWGDFFGSANTPNSIATQAKKSGLAAIYITGTYNQGEKKIIRKIDQKTKPELINSIVKFTDKIKPKYLGLGVEINIMAENNPTEFDEFVKLFGETYEAVKKNSPNTKIFPIFQLERMKGLKGGLFGGVNDLNKNDWALISQFPKADLISFTTYPGLIYKDSSEIPADYYIELKNRTNKPIIFTEIGWYSETVVKGWESSEKEQADFVKRFFDLSKDLNPEVIIWTFLYDQKTAPTFASAGLIDRNGKRKLAWQEWVKGN